MSHHLILGLILMLPLTAAIGAFAWPRAGRWIGLGLMPVLVMLTGWLALLLNGGILIQPVGGWLAPLGIQLRADGLASLLLIASSVVGLLVSIHAFGYFGSYREAGQRTQFFWPLWFFLIASLNAIFLSRDVFNLYVTLELNGFAAVSLVAIAGERKAIAASLRYIFVTLGGSLLYLMGVALLYGGTGTLDLALLAGRITSEPYSYLALVLMTGGLLMKSALFPLHFWLPPAHASAPAPVSAMLSALVVKGSYYILLRLWFEAFSGIISTEAVQFLGLLGAAAVLWGSFQALLQDRLKLLVAYSTVAQIGYLFLLFPLVMTAEPRSGILTGGLMFLISHALAKSAVFLAAGNIMRAAGHDRIRDLDGITHALPVSAFALGLAGISLVGLPPTAGFIGKWILLGEGLRQGQWWWVLVILAGSLLAAAYMTRVLIHAFTQTEKSGVLAKISPGMEWSSFTLALLSLALGFAATVPAKLLEAVFSKGSVL